MGEAFVGVLFPLGPSSTLFTLELPAVRDKFAATWAIWAAWAVATPDEGCENLAKSHQFRHHGNLKP